MQLDYFGRGGKVWSNTKKNTTIESTTIAYTVY